MENTTYEQLSFFDESGNLIESDENTTAISVEEIKKYLSEPVDDPALIEIASLLKELEVVPITNGNKTRDAVSVYQKKIKELIDNLELQTIINSNITNGICNSYTQCIERITNAFLLSGDYLVFTQYSGYLTINNDVSLAALRKVANFATSHLSEESFVQNSPKSVKDAALFEIKLDAIFDINPDIIHFVYGANCIQTKVESVVRSKFNLYPLPRSILKVFSKNEFRRPVEDDDYDSDLRWDQK